MARKSNFKKFGFRMDSDFGCSVFEPPLYSDSDCFNYFQVDETKNNISEANNIAIGITNSNESGQNNKTPKPQNPRVLLNNSNLINYNYIKNAAVD